MKYFLLLLIPTLFSFGDPIPGTDATRYSVDIEGETVEYIKLSESTSRKPILLFLQGSLPKPLFFQMGNATHLNLPFNYKSLSDRFQIVLISMPATPLVVGPANLNEQYCYIPDSTKRDEFSQAYLDADHLEHYVKRTEAVINELQNQFTGTENQTIHLIGHSQGAKIAAVVAAENNTIASVSLLGFNPYGRFDELIRREREKFIYGQITADEHTSNLENLYASWAEMVENDSEPQNRTWLSFSIDYRPYLSVIKCPIFVGYGSEDITARNCDLLPLDFIKNGKKNYNMKPYMGLDHNFFELKNGRPDYENGGNWTRVAQDIADWIESI